MPGDDIRDELIAAREHTVLGTLGIDIVEAGPERVVLDMPVGPAVHQPYGLLHGGVSVVLAETAASIGAQLAAGPGFQAFGIDINASHLRTVREGRVRTVGVPVRQGRTVAVWEMHITDDRDRLICVSRCTVAVRPLDPPAP